MIWLIAIDIDIKLFLLQYMSCMFNFSEDCLSTYKVNDMFNRLFVNINARGPACLSLLLKHIYTVGLCLVRFCVVRIWIVRVLKNTPDLHSAYYGFLAFSDRLYYSGTCVVRFYICGFAQCAHFFGYLGRTMQGPTVQTVKLYVYIYYSR